MNVASCAPASRALVNISGMSCSLSPGMTGAIETAVGIPALAKASIVANRLDIEGACGSTFLAISSEAKGILRNTRIQDSL